VTDDPESHILNPFAAAAINHLLRGASWARDELGRFAGRTARIEVAPLVLALTVLENGEVTRAATDADADVTLKLSPGLMLRLAAHDEAAWREVEVSGNTDFASSINRLARNLRWDVEEDLSRFFGDVAAHRMAEAGRAVQRWGNQTTEHVGRSLAEYWTEEDPLIAGARDVEEFNRAVDALRDNVARLEKRVESLLNRQGAKTPGKSQ
jgi:ubiquinone biosynthesis accessory factor UbiJ